MKMVYVSSLAKKPDRDSQWIKSFETLGWQVTEFSTLEDSPVQNILSRIKRRFHLGRKLRNMRRELIDLIEKENPVWVHFRLPVEFDPQTIAAIKSKKIIVTEYFNDDPFSPKRLVGYYRNFLAALSLYDVHFVYRERNIKDFQKVGAKHVFHCPPAYVPWRHKTDQPMVQKEMKTDAVFIGHWENDWRLSCLEELKRSGLNVIVKGGFWNGVIKKDSPLERQLPVTGAYGEQYNEYYSTTVAGLCFFSKINRDKWTERALEIIAVGGVLVCERTDEAARNFQDTKEAFFFSTIPELLEIVHFLKSNPGIRNEVRKAGYDRLNSGKHSVLDRSAMIIDKINRLLNQPINK